MKIIHLGTGDAFNEKLPNNSHLVISNSVSGTKLLLDCGYSALAQLFKYNPDPSFVDAVFISHLHADHYFGIPAFLRRIIADSRTKKLSIICRRENKDQIIELVKLGYSETMNKLTFPLEFIEVSQGDEITLGEFTLRFAETKHNIPNLAIRIEKNSASKNKEDRRRKKIFCYSGDGNFTESSEELYKNADMLIHEVFTMDKDTAGHGKLTTILEMCSRAKVKKLGITHINRKNYEKTIHEMIRSCDEAKVNFFIPEPLDESEI